MLDEDGLFEHSGLQVYHLDSQREGRILQTDHDVKGNDQESSKIDSTLLINRHGKIDGTYENDHETTDHHHRLIAGTLHCLANHRHAAVHCHHHR
jgi:uncharacterized surface anchored protein